MTKIIVTGAKGRMGQWVLECAAKDPEIQVLGGVDQNDSIEEYLQRGSVIIDFSFHKATPLFVKSALKFKCPMVICTTGFTEGERKAIVAASKKIPILLASNASVGVNILFSLAKNLTTLLKKDFDIEIIEKHHRHKKDAPSGTAVTLLEVISKAKGAPSSKLARHGRVGEPGARSRDEIGVHAIRGGDFVGEHTVIFAGEGETLEITHKASSREIFANGALKAAKWIAKAKPGLYDMSNTLGIK